MNSRKNRFQFLFAEKREGKLGRIILSPLCLLSFFYGVIVRLRVWAFERGLFRTHVLPCKVISIGNITLGGTGKTPLAAFLAEFFRNKGLHVAILSRGYKGEFSGERGVVTDGENILMDPRQAGDEPYLLSIKLKNIPVVVGKKRRIIGQFAAERFGAEIVILDDGFQHLQVKRDINLLLLEARAPFGNGYLFPRGSLREPIKQIKRADGLILTKAEESDNINKLKENLKKWAGPVPVFSVHFKPAGIRIHGEKALYPNGIIRDKKVLAFTGIGNPESFRRTLVGLESQVAGFVSFPDHYWFKAEDLRQLTDEGERKGAEALVTTEKDAVRLGEWPQGKIPLWIVCISPYFSVEEQKKLEEFLQVKLGAA